MRILLSLLAIIGFFYTSQAQKIQFASINFNGETINNIPRLSWVIPLRGRISSINKQINTIGGLVFKNEGVIYEIDSNRIKHRNLVIAPEFGISFIIKERYLFNASFGIDYNFHYKEKFVEGGLRKNTMTVDTGWNHAKTSIFNPYSRLVIGFKNGVSILYEHYFIPYLNKDFRTVNENGIPSFPYAELYVSKFNLGLTILFWQVGSTKEIVF